MCIMPLSIRIHDDNIMITIVRTMFVLFHEENQRGSRQVEGQDALGVAEERDERDQHSEVPYETN